MKKCPECGWDAWCHMYEDAYESWECLKCGQIFLKPYTGDEWEEE